MSTVTQINAKIGKYRWTICALLFFATTVNYLDRQVLSLLKGDLEREFNWNDSDYANILTVFQFVYAISMLFAGRIIDWLGTKSGYAWSLIVWSVGAMVHALAKGTGGFMVARGILGFGESGNFPAAIKTTAEWFPKKERALATGIFNSGTNVGAILAPLTVPWLALNWGWQGAFIIVGGIGFLWLLAWLPLYNLPGKVGPKQRTGAWVVALASVAACCFAIALGVAKAADFVTNLCGFPLNYYVGISFGALVALVVAYFAVRFVAGVRRDDGEIAYIHSDVDEQAVAAAEAKAVANNEPKLAWYVEWSKLLGYRQTWAFAFGKFMTDGVWWFFLFWLPAFLKAQYGMTGTQVAIPLAVLYTMTCVGSIGGGWFPIYFINRGYEPYAGRMRAMLLIAFFPLVVLLAQPFGYISFWVPVILIGIGASAHQAWSANIFTTVSDMFPKKAVGSVTGIGGMFGGFGGIVVSQSAGWLFDAYRQAGIAKCWAQAKAGALGGYLDQILALKLVNKHDSAINLNMDELGNLPKEVSTQLQAINPHAFDQLKQLQTTVVQGEMYKAYSIMFAVCAVAYLIAWVVMKTLVPKYRKIENL